MTLQRKLSRGFTLLELMVVIAIIGLLVGLVGPKVMDILSNSQSDTAKIQAKSLEQAVNMFRLDVGRIPSSAEGLQALVTKPGSASGWRGPYIKELPVDPWKNPYHYDAPGKHGEFDIYSLGADNAPGGEGSKADVGNW